MDILHYLEKGWVLAEYECWELVVDIYQREKGITLPKGNIGTMDCKAVREAFASNPSNDLFKQIEYPEHLCVVLMGKRWPSHVGVYLETADGPRILHNRQASGVLCQPVSDVAEQIKIIGYYGLK